ncbi:hypothetical protein [Segatella baroniae]|uniref:hypothetical protein n=1 Tax=Segatella baroniae TaxID=305719 RepID=UPI0012DD4D9D|nr:hypothetical protein [Segatella baroniae]
MPSLRQRAKAWKAAAHEPPQPGGATRLSRPSPIPRGAIIRTIHDHTTLLPHSSSPPDNTLLGRRCRRRALAIDENSLK